MRFLVLPLAVLAGTVVLMAVVFVAYGREKTWERLAGPADRGQVDLRTVIRRETPNDALAGTVGLRADAEIILPVYAQSAETLLQRFADNIAAVDPLARRIDDGSDGRHMRFVTYSPVLRFPDIVVVQAVDLEQGQTGLLVYAAAQLGRYDFGANRRRLERYLSVI